MTSPLGSVMTAEAMPSMTFGKSLIQMAVPPGLSLATQSDGDALRKERRPIRFVGGEKRFVVGRNDAARSAEIDVTDRPGDVIEHAGHVVAPLGDGDAAPEVGDLTGGARFVAATGNRASDL